MTDIELIKKYMPKVKQKRAIKKLNNGYPVQYIIGNVDFFNSIIKVNPNVLIPRFETEYLVEKTIKYLNKLNIKKPKVLEIGTGSGCISIALRKKIEADITAIDISSKAIKLAKDNARLNNVNIFFIKKSIENITLKGKYDLIISNPPYVAIGDSVDEKTKFEPQNAIFAKEEGLYFYKQILNKVKNNLSNNYLIAFEIGKNESKKIEQVAKEDNILGFYKVEKDYNNLERYFFISKQKI